MEIARTLPSVDELQTRASQFETTYILDRNGNILYEIVDPNAGKRTYVPLERSPYLIAATIATEDKEYYNHPGFDLIALVGRFIPTTPGWDRVGRIDDHAATGAFIAAHR